MKRWAPEIGGDRLFAKMVMGRLGPHMGKTHPNRMPGGLQTKCERQNKQGGCFLDLEVGKDFLNETKEHYHEGK